MSQVGSCSVLPSAWRFALGPSDLWTRPTQPWTSARGCYRSHEIGRIPYESTRPPPCCETRILCRGRRGRRLLYSPHQLPVQPVALRAETPGRKVGTCLKKQHTNALYDHVRQINDQLAFVHVAAEGNAEAIRHGGSNNPICIVPETANHQWVGKKCACRGVGAAFSVLLRCRGRCWATGSGPGGWGKKCACRESNP